MNGDFMVLIKGGQMKQKIIKPGVVRRIAEKIADEGINIPKETVDICFTKQHTRTYISS